jgi:hypothetical protein
MRKRGQVTGVVVVEVREAVVAGEGDEVVVTGGLVALEAAGHVGMILLGSFVWGFFDRTRHSGGPFIERLLAR